MRLIVLLATNLKKCGISSKVDDSGTSIGKCYCWRILANSFVK